MPDDLSQCFEITRVANLSRTTCAITYARVGGPVGRARVNAAEWPEGYWPPRIGDLIETEPTIILKARPR